MVLDEMVDKLTTYLEREHPDLTQGLRDSWNRHHGTVDGHWVSELQQQILSLFGRFSDSDKVEAYNEIAEAEGLGRLDDSTLGIDYWIHDAFTNEVIDRLLETGHPNGNVLE